MKRIKKRKIMETIWMMPLREGELASFDNNQVSLISPTSTKPIPIWKGEIPITVNTDKESGRILSWLSFFNCLPARAISLVEYMGVILLKIEM